VRPRKSETDTSMQFFTNSPTLSFGIPRG